MDLIVNSIEDVEYDVTLYLILLDLIINFIDELEITLKWKFLCYIEDFYLSSMDEIWRGLGNGDGKTVKEDYKNVGR